MGLTGIISPSVCPEPLSNNSFKAKTKQKVNNSGVKTLRAAPPVTPSFILSLLRQRRHAGGGGCISGHRRDRSISAQREQRSSSIIHRPSTPARGRRCHVSRSAGGRPRPPISGGRGGSRFETVCGLTQNLGFLGWVL